jgi:hypothetical protein
VCNSTPGGAPPRLQHGAPGRASLLLALGVSLAPGARLTLFLRHKSGVVYLAAGVAARPRGGRVEVHMPLDATLSLAELAGGRAEYSYAAEIKGLSLPSPSWFTRSTRRTVSTQWRRARRLR